jgi:Gram-negative bacterial TonB protein C-terminal
MKPVEVVAPVYPPIAKAAHLQGVIISRLEFGSSGNVSKVEIVSGHPLLAKSVEAGEGHWVSRTDGNPDGCQILVISEFSLSDSEKANDDERPWPYTSPGIYRQRIRALFLPPLNSLY